MADVLLLVEDNPADVELTRFALEDAEVEADLVVVEDGTDALAYLRGEGAFNGARRPTAVLLDIRLPRLDGTDVLREVRADDALRSLHVIMLTADDDVEGALGHLAGECDGYLVKPVRADHLRAALDATRDPG